MGGRSSATGVARVTDQAGDAAKPNREPARSDYPVVASFAEGKARTGTSTSWARLLWDFEEARDYFFGLDTEYSYMLKRVKGLKSLFSPRQSTNFPFGDPSSDLQSREYLLSQLPAREIVEALLHNYMRTYEKLFPLWHQPSFDQNMKDFWESPQFVERTFLAQIYMMLALSCHSAPDGVAALRQLDLVELSHTFFGLADAAFKGSQFMMVHDLAVLRTLCMAAIAKIMDLITFNDARSCSLLMGLVVRLAENMSMHRQPSLFVGMSQSEGLTRQRIWTTITYLDLATSVSTSLPPLIRPDDHDVFSMSDLPENSAKGCDADELAGFQNLLSEALPLASSIISTANSVKPEVIYDEVEKTDKKLRNILNRLNKVEMGDGVDAFSLQGIMLQRAMLQIFVRRMLLILHEPFARDPKLSTGYKTSRFAVMECSLALVLCHGSLSEAATLGNPVEWFLNFFKEDFGIAAIYVTRAIRRNDFDTDAHLLPHTCPREIAWTALRRSAEILEEHAGDSVNHFRIYMGVVHLVAALEALDSGIPMLEKMLEAGRTVIRKIHEKKGVEVGDMDLSPAAEVTPSNSDEMDNYQPDDWVPFGRAWLQLDQESESPNQQSLFF
ncbi:hypothetical protein CkaCkLH20_12882 [Colletotrichum karsti]|uniref:Xylanolytic transcriptional activator regulatory domain-containing protein n=1 Tax=Colletotrichum karsti TaxID=1095194 RepID=A0A9P6I0L9_9PEZI|nr:uncharacterized protein CkaCkLH20_12882 [Colletotrichum karsti]KAF9869695.1 hypothetical protein CkaCkLH20_12882 [Colletotrichum karsti]